MMEAGAVLHGLVNSFLTLHLDKIDTTAFNCSQFDYLKSVN